jgi:hypothetical protein
MWKCLRGVGFNRTEKRTLTHDITPMTPSIVRSTAHELPAAGSLPPTSLPHSHPHPHRYPCPTGLFHHPDGRRCPPFHSHPPTIDPGPSFRVIGHGRPPKPEPSNLNPNPKASILLCPLRLTVTRRRWRGSPEKKRWSSELDLLLL